MLRAFFPSVLWRFEENIRNVYFTFDDGPHPEVTLKVLDLLDAYEAKATFFCIGKNVRMHPVIYNELLNRGHATGNHTEDHVNAWRVSRELYLENVTAASDVIKSDLFRPPYGKITPALINRLKLKYTIVLWDVISYDFDNSISDEQVYLNVIKNIRPGSIVVFHDSLKAAPSMLKALPRVLDFCKTKNYSLCALDSNNHNYKG